MKTEQNVREKLEIVQRQIAETALVIAEEEAHHTTTSTRLEEAIDNKLRLEGTVGALLWVLGEEGGFV